MCLGYLRRTLYIGGGGIEFAETNIVTHAAIEQEHVLWNHANLAAQAV